MGNQNGELAKLRYKNLIQKVFTRYLFYNILSYMEVSIDNEYAFLKLKKKVLDFGNNAMRFLQKQCDKFEFEELVPIIEELFVLEEIEAPEKDSEDMEKGE